MLKATVTVTDHFNPLVPNAHQSECKKKSTISFTNWAAKSQLTH